jgi:hypothetical protein
MFTASLEKEFSVGAHGIFFFCGDEVFAIDGERRCVIERNILRCKSALEKARKAAAVDFINTGHGSFHNRS